MGYSATRDVGGYSGPVDVAAVGDVYRRHYASLVVDAVDDPVTCLGRSSLGARSWANRKREAVSLFEKRASGLGTGEGLNPRPLGYEPYDARLYRLKRSLVGALTSINLRHEVALGPARLPRLRLSRRVRFTNPFTDIEPST
jgi:hypothetical protein